MFKSSPTTFPLKTISGIFTAALLAFTSLSFPKAEDQNRAYRDFLGRPTICTNHHKNVRMTDVVTDKQCASFLAKDLADAVNVVLFESPQILENKSAMRAASEFVMNTNAEAYKNSPMVAYFKEKKWEEGCREFQSYYVLVEFAEDHLEHDCTLQPNKMYLCKIKELEKLRREQMLICLGKL
jgi:GH24 family phage-related lysozyme (muramidase)